MSDYQKSLDNISSTVSDTAKKTALLPVNIAKDTVVNGVKSGFSAINPFDKSINTKDVTDTGSESIRLGYRTVKHSKNTIKTTKNTIKTTKNAIKTTKKSIKFTYDVAKLTGKAVVTTAHIAVKVVSYIVAIVVNPIFLIAAAMLTIIVIISGIITIIMGAIAGGATSNQAAHSSAIGTGDVAAAYQTAVGYYNNAVAAEKEGFNYLIDRLVYDNNNLPTSDLVYMERTKPEPKVIYQTGFANSAQKNTLKDSLNSGIISAIDAISIAYVYLEKEKNIENGTEGGVYEVTFTQDVFNTLLDNAVNHRNMIYTGQYCGGTCARTVDYVPNEPYYSQAETAMILANNAYEELKEIVELIEYNKKIPNGAAQTAHWNNNISEKVDRWNQTHGIIYQEKYNTKEIEGYDYEKTFTVVETVMYDCQDKFAQTPQYIEVEYLSCNYQHNLHSIGLALLTADDLMTALNFTENDKFWVESTKRGYQNIGFS